MLKSLTLENFTVFANTELEFSPGINVIIGENGTGKTHLLKAGYCLNRAWPDLMREQLPLNSKRAEVFFESKLMGLFKPDDLGNLVRRSSGVTEARLRVEITGFGPSEKTINTVQIDGRNWTNYSTDIPGGHVSWEVIVNKGEAGSGGQVLMDDESIKKITSTKLYVANSVFIPSKEIASFYDGLGALLKEYRTGLDDTYPDLIEKLNIPEMTNRSLGDLQELEDILGGFLKLENARLIFVGKDGQVMEVPLLAEGLRKLAILPYLIRNGVLHVDDRNRPSTQGEALFWDEPEANLNPRLIAKLAQLFVFLAKRGTQVVLATHSLFLLKEIDLQLQLAIENNTAIPARFFALSLGENGVETSVGNVLEEINPITALDMEIEQAERYNDWYDRVSHAK